jgi:hypothetical protein
MTPEVPLETHMKRKELTTTIPMHDYRAALQGAVSWLGDRYLLAEPVRRINEQRPYFAEQRRWHPAVITGALAKHR